ncbi:MAG: tRNA (adenosine(37)-N6)-threonylcarbamoyltransferase complex dimerization subunit type 1 TsaB [Pseudomonadota bacterium]
MTVSSPTILAFDTSGKHCAAALMVRGDLVASRFEPMDRGQAERLLPLLEEVLAGASTSWQDLDAVGVGVGPGNFTGIRISVSAARGLALALGVPAIGVSTFEIVAAHRYGMVSAGDWPGHIDIPGPRNTVYRQAFDARRPSGDPFVVTLDANDTTDRIEPLGWHGGLLTAFIERTAEKFGRAEAPRPVPLYVRPADAAPPKDAGPLLLP